MSLILRKKIDLLIEGIVRKSIENISETLQENPAFDGISNRCTPEKVKYMILLAIRRSVNELIEKHPLGKEISLAVSKRKIK